MLSNHKFASNVVEKCLEYGSEKERKEIIDEIMEHSYDDAGDVNQQMSGALYQMMKDRYGNYVIQKCIEVSKGKQREVLVQKITKCANVLRKQANYSRHVYNFIEKMSGGGALEGNNNGAYPVNMTNEHSNASMYTQGYNNEGGM